MKFDSRICVAGGDTLIGAAILRRLLIQGYKEAINRREPEPDLTDGAETEAFFARYVPEYVFLAAGKSGGIQENMARPAELMRDNLLVTTSVVHAAWKTGVRKLLYLASSCSYPRNSPQPMAVGSLMSGPLEPTNEPYAMAKMAGVSLCRAYRLQYGADFFSVFPANAFGPGDDFRPESSHVIPALLRKMHEAKMAGAPFVDVWGSGRPRREFIYSDDLADSCIYLMQKYDRPGPVNVGGGTTVSIGELAALVQEVVGYRGVLRFDSSKPDGMPLKSLDSGELAAMGWQPATPLREALATTYDWFLSMSSTEAVWDREDRTSEGTVHSDGE
ncbi:MAG: GDP-L-fucose synthase [Deltaproteobacteria bacterium]|nr:GDP-L-fucose synthase [Deltaproteobacteria bacterium]MDA8179220.1 GDP-L-fucose synthase [Deltaproteobacteria bacterium]